MPRANSQKRHHRYRSPASGEEEVGAAEGLEAVSELPVARASRELAAEVPCSPDLASVLRPHTLVA